MAENPKTRDRATGSAPKKRVKAAASGSTGKRNSSKPKNKPEVVKEVVKSAPEFLGAIAEENERLRLTSEQKVYIVRALACFCQPVEVIKEMKEIWGVVVSKQLMQGYDPSTRRGSELRGELKELFYATRREFESRIRKISTVDQTVRLVRLDQIFNRYFESGNLQAARETLRQIAEETGGKYTNTQNHNIKGNVKEQLASLLGVSVEQLPKTRNGER